MTTIALQDAQQNLGELFENLKPGEEILITKGNVPVGKLLSAGEKPKRKLGTQAGSVIYMAPDFDEPLDDFEEYMK